MTIYLKMILYADGNIKSYVLTDKYNVVVLHGKRDSFRCRQRNTDDSLKFISYKHMEKIIKRNNKYIYGNFNFDTKSRL